MAVTRFYRDGLGFEVLGEFKEHDGFDGVMFGHMGAAYHLEFTRERGRQREFYAVARAPGLLTGMAYPRDIDWQSLRVAGYRHVVCLTEESPKYDPVPLSVLYAAALQDLAGGVHPRQPEHEERCIRDAVSRIVPRLRKGEGVVVHCHGGTGRTGTVIACSLKALGVPPEDVIAQMKAVNAARLKCAGWKGWPESPWQQELFDRF